MILPYYFLFFSMVQDSVLVSYHSNFVGQESEIAYGIPLLPITPKTEFNADTSTHDIVDEAIHLYRANILFKNYKIKGPADRILIYLTCFIQKSLEQMQRFKTEEQQRRVIGMIVADPGAIDITNATFFMNKLGLLQANGAQAKKCKDYLKKLIEETSTRLQELLYREGEGDMNRKYWMGMSKRPFLGQKFIDKQIAL